MKKILLILAMVALFATVSQASTITLTDPLVSGSDLYYVGSVTPGHPASESEVAGYINQLITYAEGSSAVTYADGNTYDRSLSNTTLFDDWLPQVTDVGAAKQEGSNTTFNATGFNYVIGKYDATKAGILVWYNPDIDGFAEVVLPSTFNGHDLSNTQAFNLWLPGDPDPPTTSPIPEPATMFLFGIGLMGIAGMGRRRKKFEE